MSLASQCDQSDLPDVCKNRDRQLLRKACMPPGKFLQSAKSTQIPCLMLAVSSFGNLSIARNKESSAR
jgi:hypothetical protein